MGWASLTEKNVGHTANHFIFESTLTITISFYVWDRNNHLGQKRLIVLKLLILYLRKKNFVNMIANKLDIYLGQKEIQLLIMYLEVSCVCNHIGSWIRHLSMRLECPSWTVNSVRHTTANLVFMRIFRRYFWIF